MTTNEKPLVNVFPRMDAKTRKMLEELPPSGNRKPLFSSDRSEELLPPSNSPK